MSGMLTRTPGLRKANWITATVCTWLLIAVAAAARPISPKIVNPDNGHVYLLLEAATWQDSEAEAVALGGHLATVRSQAEEDWIVRTFGSYGGEQRLLWIGLSDIQKKFHFSWSSGESVSYTCWAKGEPNNALRGEDFVAIYYPNHSQGGKWNDWHDRTEDPIGLPMCGVVEIIPPRKAAASPSAAETETIAIRPELTISSSSNKVRLAWPASAAPYMLEGTTDLQKPFTLFGYSETTDAHLGEVSVVLTNPAGPMYFRLRKAKP